GSAPFRPQALREARCSLLGYTPRTIHVEGTLIGHWFMQVDTQPEVGEEGYDKGAAVLREFFHQQLKKYLEPDLDPVGKKIIECCLNDGSAEEYDMLIKRE